MQAPSGLTPLRTAGPLDAVRRLLDVWLAAPLVVRALGCAGHLALIWFVSDMPGTARRPAPVWKSLLHNGAHVVVFAALATLIWALFGRTRRENGRSIGRREIVALAAATAYGVVDEVHQSMVKGRDASLFDVLSDGFGALFGIAILALLVRPSGTESGFRWGLLGLSCMGGLASVLLATLC